MVFAWLLEAVSQVAPLGDASNGEIAKNGDI